MDRVITERDQVDYVFHKELTAWNQGSGHPHFTHGNAHSSRVVDLNFLIIGDKGCVQRSMPKKSTK